MSFQSSADRAATNGQGTNRSATDRATRKGRSAHEATATRA